MITPYLTFDGDCEKAIDFYKDALGVEVGNLMRMGDAPSNPEFPIPESAKNRIMQVTLNLGTMILRMSDCFPGQPFDSNSGDRISFTLCPKTADEGKVLFEKLKVDGVVTMQPEKTFFSSYYCALTDKFGIKWQISAE